MAKRNKRKGKNGTDAQEITVPPEWTKRGIAVFDAMVKDREGIKATESKLEEQKESTAGRLLKLAQDVQADGKGVDVFLAICKTVETHEKEKHRVSNLRQICPTWVQVKSDIKKAWQYTDAEGNHPFTPDQFTNAQTLKEELREATSAANGNGDNASNRQAAKVFGNVSDAIREEAEKAVHLIRQAGENPETAALVLEQLQAFNAAIEEALGDILGEQVARPANAPEGMQEVQGNA